MRTWSTRWASRGVQRIWLRIAIMLADCAWRPRAYWKPGVCPGSGRCGLARGARRSSNDPRGSTGPLTGGDRR